MVINRAKKIYKNKNLLKITNDPCTAVEGANVLYTDVWSSMGEEKQKIEKDKDFLGFTIDQTLVRNADKDAIILHCLPAYRSKEITDEVIESKKIEFLNKLKIDCRTTHFYLPSIGLLKTKFKSNVLEYICFYVPLLAMILQVRKMSFMVG